MKTIKRIIGVIFIVLGIYVIALIIPGFLAVIGALVLIILGVAWCESES